MTMRVVIIDDDPDMRNELQNLLEIYHPDFEIVASVADPALVLQKIEAGGIEGVFLDINFEEKGKRLGLEFAKRISRLPRAPWIIFITNYPENVFEAIQIRPFGFITKPIEHFTLETALDNVNINYANAPSPVPVNMIEIRYHIFVLIDGKPGPVKRTRFLAPKEIKYIQSNQGVDTVKVYLVNGEILDHVTLRLSKWLNFNLPCFVQISKNTIVHLKYANGFKLNSARFDAHLVTFRDDSTELPIGAAFFDAFKDTLKNGKLCCG